MPERPPTGIHLDGIHLDGTDGRPVFKGVDLRLEAGGALLVSGSSAFARGQLLRMCGGLTEPTQGRVVLSGIQLWPGEGLPALKGRTRIGLAFGHHGLLANLSLQENLELPLLFGFATPSLRIRDMVKEELQRFGMEDLAGMRPHLLGERATRLANLIRVKLLDPEIILLDDPFEELEAQDMVEIRGWMDAWLKTPGRILVAAADEPDPRAYPRIHRMELLDGRLMEAA